VLVVVVSLAAFVTALRTEARRLRERSLDGDSRASRPTDGVDSVVRRLTQQAGVPTPEVRITAYDRPAAFTIGAGEMATLVVSKGLLVHLPPAELEAVLAHEVSHLANGDSRLMALALPPVVFAEDLFEDDPDDLGEWFWWLFDRALLLYGQLGVAVLSRGREWAADAGAAALTGSPAALASALVRLNEARGPPPEDLREWSDALVALDVLPTLSADGTLRGWAFRTHPSTDARVTRLRRLAAELERE
jgi:heat shock protein HtpX